MRVSMRRIIERRSSRPRFLSICALAVLSGAFAFRDSLAVWIEQSVNVNSYIAVVQAVDHNIVWAVGNNAVVLVTTNGGVNWATRTVPGAANVRGLFAFDDQNCSVADQQGRFWRTSNGGAQWVLVHGPLGSSINGIHFFDLQNGWAMGDPVNGHYVIVLSTDGGWTWTPAPNAPPGTFTAQVRSYDWIGTQIGAFTTRQRVIWRTTNAGTQWDSVGLDIYWLSGIELSNSGIGLASGHDGEGTQLLRRSTDSGATWIPAMHPPQATSMRNFDWIEGTDEVWGATNQTGVFQSTNAGIDWVRHTIPPEVSVGDIDFIDRDTGWCVGGLVPGRIFRWSTTAGITLLPTAPIPMEVTAYPNPFQSEVILEIATAHRAPAECAVYDVTGHKIWSAGAAVGPVLAADRYRWDGRDHTGRPVPSGTYFYRVEAGGRETTGRIVKVP